MPLETRLLHGTVSSTGARGGARIGLGSCMICAGPIGFEWLLPRTKRCMLHSGTRCCCSSQLRCTNNTVTRVRFGLWRDRCPSRRSQEISASDRRLDQNYGPLPQTLSRPESESLFTRFSSFPHLQRQTYIERPRSIHYRLAGRCLCFFAEGVSALFVVFVFLKPCPDSPLPGTHHHHHHLVPTRAWLIADLAENGRPIVPLSNIGFSPGLRKDQSTNSTTHRPVCDVNLLRIRVYFLPSDLSRLLLAHLRSLPP